MSKFGVVSPAADSQVAPSEEIQKYSVWFAARLTSGTRMRVRLHSSSTTTRSVSCRERPLAPPKTLSRRSSCSGRDGKFVHVFVTPSLASMVRSDIPMADSREITAGVADCGRIGSTLPTEKAQVGSGSSTMSSVSKG